MTYEELPVIYTGTCREIPQTVWKAICEMVGGEHDLD